MSDIEQTIKDARDALPGTIRIDAQEIIDMAAAEIERLRGALAHKRGTCDICPTCGGPADNGHDREYPPNTYCCTKCAEMSSKRGWWEDERTER